MITLDYYGVEGRGRTVTDAKKDAGEKIRAGLSGSYSPRLLVWRGYAILIYREPDGYCQRLVADPERGPIDGVIHASPNDRTEKDALASARRHLAQLGWKQEDGQNPPPFLTDRSDVSDYRYWAEFQLRYRWAVSHGLKDTDAHDYAGRNPMRPEVQTQIPAYVAA